MPERDNAPYLSHRYMQHAKLVPSRVDILADLKTDLTFIEVGVALGDFTVEVLKRCKVRNFIALDMYDMERWPDTWGGRVGRELAGKSHLEYYKQKFANEISAGQMSLMVGDSVASLKKLPHKCADVIYLDSDHAYQHVKNELAVTKQLIKDDGVIIFNDYIMHDHYRNVPYGVIQAANEFMLEEGWEITHFALHNQMFCDVAVRKMKG